MGISGLGAGLGIRVYITRGRLESTGLYVCFRQSLLYLS